MMMRVARGGHGSRSSWIVAYLSLGIVFAVMLIRFYQRLNVAYNSSQANEVQIAKLRELLNVQQSRLEKIEAKLSKLVRSKVQDAISTDELFLTRERAADILSTVSEEEIGAYQRFTEELPLPDVKVSLKPNDVVLDIGANLGKFTQLMRARCPLCVILSFEAIPQYAAYVTSKVKPDEKTFVASVALGEKYSKTKMFKDPSNFGWNTLVSQMKTEGMQATEVTVMRLDDLDLSKVVDTSKVRVIKIDTEGFEPFVLGGAHRFLESLNPKPLLIIEVAWGSNDNPNWTRVEVEMTWLFAHGWRRVNIYSLSKTEDVLLYPEDWVFD